MLDLHCLKFLLKYRYHFYVFKWEPYLVLQLYVLSLPPLVRLCDLKQSGLDLANLHLLNDFNLLLIKLTNGLFSPNMGLQSGVLNLQSFNFSAQGQNLWAFGFKLWRSLADVSHRSLQDFLLHLELLGVELPTVFLGENVQWWGASKVYKGLVSKTYFRSFVKPSGFRDRLRILE